MSTPKHTPGPWKFDGYQRVRPVTGRDTGVDDIAHVFGESEMTIADANLIASAPELAECMSELLSILRDSTTFMQYTEEKARAAALLERLGM